MVRRLRTISVACAFALVAARAQAQSLRGVVTEGQTGHPVAGAVVLLMDSTGFVVTRAVTSERGEYFVRRPPEVVRGQVLRLGYRPRPISAADLAAVDANGELAITITAIPQMLEPVIARAGAKCPKRKDSQAAFGFWEQAKAGLMSSVYAREGSPGYFTTLSYERASRPNSDSIQRQKVSADSGLWTRTFIAMFTAHDFVEVGFVRNQIDGHAMYYGPDAEVLLENDFQTRYCFSLAARDPKRPTQVGLHFAPVKAQMNRVDIEGNFWIDTASRKLVEIVYAYAGMRGPEGHEPGGHVRFRELANGVPFVDSWNIRMATQVVTPARKGYTRGGGTGDFGAPRGIQYDVTNGGGVLAHARWPDGTRYDAPLGTVRIHAFHDDGSPVSGLAITLDSTIYAGTTDSSGTLVIKDLLPGPYSTMIIDSTLDIIGLKLRSPLDFVAVADSTVDAALLVRQPAEALANTCKNKPDGRPYDGWAVLVARVATPDNKPVEGARWTMGNKFGSTTDNGVILPCIEFRVGDKGSFAVWRDHGFPSPDKPADVAFEIKSLVTAIRVELPFPTNSKKP